MIDTPLALYRAEVEAGRSAADPVQAAAARHLDALHHAILHYRPARAAGWRARLGLGARRAQAPRGLYLHGGVGRGKSMLMDLFYGAARPPGDAKRRVHFHAFMIEVHQRLHAWRERNKLAGRREEKESDPLPRIAADLCAATTLLCFDEFQVTNVADAMILGRLFTALLDLGVVVVATSNRAPDDLYRNGLQRDRFLPFIALLKDRLDVLHLDGEVDYRLRRIADMDVYYAPADARAASALDAAFHRLVDDAAGERVAPEPMVLPVNGRELAVSAQARGTARFSFEELCGRPLGAADYLAIAREFHTVILAGIPAMGPENRDRAARFVTLIDALYEHKVKLVCSAAAAPDRLYPAGDGAFEFARTASRLIEMQSREYKALLHITGAG